MGASQALLRGPQSFRLHATYVMRICQIAQTSSGTLTLFELQMARIPCQGMEWISAFDTDLLNDHMLELKILEDPFA